MATTWADKEKEYIGVGFNAQQINEYKEKKRQEYLNAGVDPQAVATYFGDKSPDESILQKHFQKNLSTYQPKEADGILQAIDAGWQLSSSDLIYKAAKGKNINPDTIISEHAPSYMKVASGLAQIAGDLPAMVAGQIMGKAAGSAITAAVTGNPFAAAIGGEVGGMAGANAAPEFIRTALMEYYNRGEMKTAAEFSDFASTVFLKTAKAGTIGAVTSVAGMGAGNIAGKFAAKSSTVAASKLATEIVTMTTVSKALEGELPNAEDFVNAAAIVGSVHAISSGISYLPKTTTKLREIYAKTGIRPEQVVEDAEVNPALKQELLSDNDNVPTYGIEGKAAEKADSATAEMTPAETTPAKAYTNPHLERIGAQPEKPSGPEFAKTIYRDVVDKYDPIKQSLKELGPETTAEKVYRLFRMIPDYKAKAQTFIEKGTLSFKDLSYTGKSFEDIIKPIRNMEYGIEKFKTYLISKRALELEKRGLDHGFDVEFSKKFIKENSSTFEAMSKEFYDYNDRMVDYLVGSGRISKQAAKQMKEMNQSYVSFQRIMDAYKPSGKGRTLIKSIIGSERQIQDPFVSMVQNFEAYFKAAEENRAKLAFIDEATRLTDEFIGPKQEGETPLVSKEKTPIRAVEVSSEEIAKALKDQGYADVTPEAFDIFRSQSKDLKANQIEIWRDGNREVWNINDPVLAESLKSLEWSPKSMNPVMQIFRSITRVKKLGIQIVPEFLSRNFFRDTVASSVFTKSEGISAIDAINAGMDIIKKNDDFYRWLKSGGANGAFIELGESYVNNKIYKSKEFLSARERVMNAVLKPVHFIELAGNLAEQSTRLAEFKRVSKGAESGEMLLQGGMASREVTLDFQRIGLKIQAANQIIAFLNPSIQGIDKMARSIKEDPAGFGTRAALYITAPSVLLWFANKDDERYQEIPQWQKDYFWIIPTDDWQEATASDNWTGLPKYLVKQENGKTMINRGIVYRVPKPQELGIFFGSIPERILNAYYKDNKSATFQLQDTLVSSLMPNAMPDAMQPMLEQMTNHSFFSGNQLVPFYLEKSLPEDQYKEYTSETARLLGKIIGYVPFIGNAGPDGTKISSPLVVENYVRSWTGTLGGYALNVADAGLRAAGAYKTKVEPTKSVADIPFIKAFVARYPTMSSDSMQRFTEELKKQENIQASFKLRLDRLQVEGAAGLIAEHQTGLVKLDGFKKAITNLNSVINKVYYNDGMTADEKRQLIDTSYYQMIEISKYGLELTRQLDETAKKLKKETKQ